MLTTADNKFDIANNCHDFDCKFVKFVIFGFCNI